MLAGAAAAPPPWAGAQTTAASRVKRATRPNGACTGSLLLPRDETFDVAPREGGGLPWHDVLNTALDADYN